MEAFDHIYGLRVVVRDTVISLTLMNIGFTSTLPQLFLISGDFNSISKLRL